MKKHSKEMGFTLVELVFVVAIILVLAGIFLPIGLSKLEKADETRTTADTQAIATGLTTFFDDLRRFPACDSTDCSPLTNSKQQLQFLAFGDGTDDLSGNYPLDSSSLGGATDAGAWILSDADESEEAVNNAYNHLTSNDPNASGATDASDYEESSGKVWDGPYMAKLDFDPFGNTYFAHVGAMATGGNPINSGDGWILSAGPNGEIETGTTSTSLLGDDIGFIFFTR